MKIAVLSRDASLYSTRRLVEAGQLRGHQVDVIDHLKCSLEMEKENPALYYKNRYLEGYDAVIPRLVRQLLSLEQPWFVSLK